MVSTLAPQAGNAGSNPAGGTKKNNIANCYVVFLFNLNLLMQNQFKNY